MPAAVDLEELALAQDDALRNLPATHIECDEICSYVGMKAKNVPEERRDDPGLGDVWTWTAFDPDSKLMCSWMVGDRTTGTAYDFMSDLRGRIPGRVQITTDGHLAYRDAIEAVWGADADYAQLVKNYGEDDNMAASPTARRYSPNKVLSQEVIVVSGNPDTGLASTSGSSGVERSNLTMRMGMRRFTRLTNGFSKKAENLAAAVSLHFMYYNFARPHTTLGGKPLRRWPQDSQITAGRSRKSRNFLSQTDPLPNFHAS